MLPSLLDKIREFDKTNRRDMNGIAGRGSQIHSFCRLFDKRTSLARYQTMAWVSTATADIKDLLAGNFSTFRVDFP